MKYLGTVALVLVIVGGLNWALVGFMSLNLVTTLVGEGVLSTLVYGLVGLSAIYLAATDLPKALK